MSVQDLKYLSGKLIKSKLPPEQAFKKLIQALAEFEKLYNKYVEKIKGKGHLDADGADSIRHLRDLLSDLAYDVEDIR